MIFGPFTIPFCGAGACRLMAIESEYGANAVAQNSSSLDRQSECGKSGRQQRSFDSVLLLEYGSGKA